MRNLLTKINRNNIKLVTQMSLNYRAEINGLRALAVIPVILFHADFEIFKKGFLGVDIFFVIFNYSD